jgi:hypothetical protein
MSNKPKIKLPKNRSPQGIKEFELKAGIRSNMSCRQQLNLALAQCSKGNIPDYSTFQNWYLYKAKDDESSLFPDEDYSHISIKYATTAALSELSIKTKVSSHDGADYIKDYSKLKLLIFLFNNSERGKDAVLNLLNNNPRSEQITLRSDIRNCSASELRQHFFTAIRIGDNKLALKIIGTLQKFSELHDDCELDYLEALCHYKSNDFNLAIEYALNVRPTAIDYKNALRICIESHAFLGNTAEAIDHIYKLGAENLTDAQLMYIYQVLCINSHTPEDASKNFQEVLLGIGHSITIDNKDPGYSKCSKLHATLLIRFYERLALGERRIECEAINKFVQPVDYGDEVAGDIEFRRLFSALAFDRAIFEDDLKTRNKSERILHLLFQGVEQPDFELYFLALQAQFRLEDHHDFLNNMIRLKPYLISVSDTRKVDLFMAAYQVALAEDPEMADVFLQLLKESFQPEEELEVLKTKAREMAIAKRLTPMGRDSYEASNSALVKGMRDGKWRDAGLISLGYFRVIEVELNSRLVLPLSGFADNGLSSEIWRENKDQIEKFLKGPIGKKKKERAEFASDFWDEIVGRIERIGNGKEHGLELGSLCRLLHKLKAIEGEDAAIKEFYRSRLCSLLTEDGIAALALGELACIIDEKITLRFRNAPAHSRFVSLDIAMECKTYVDDSLERIFKWIASYNGRE